MLRRVDLHAVHFDRVGAILLRAIEMRDPLADAPLCIDGDRSAGCGAVSSPNSGPLVHPILLRFEFEKLLTQLYLDTVHLVSLRHKLLTSSGRVSRLRQPGGYPLQARVMAHYLLAPHEPGAGHHRRVS
jgi:hypothetical protein